MAKLETIDLKDMSDQMEEYQRISEQINLLERKIKPLEFKKDSLEQEFKDRMENADIGFMDGYQVSYKRGVRKTLNQKLLKLTMPKVYEDFCEEKPSRRFSIKKMEDKAEVEDFSF